MLRCGLAIYHVNYKIKILFKIIFFLLYSLGLEEDKIDEDRRGIRLEAIHFRGLKDMNTKDVFEYYREFNPGDVEWIDDQSCKLTISRSYT